ncbi:MAG: hypothetical protein O6940_05900, partial [Ignavibacteria bacterium]|nr:hypothetical protein [Ignavibacteria bacterium]
MSQQLFTPNSLGGFFTNNQLSQKLRTAAQPLLRFRQFVMPEGKQGPGNGEKVFFDKISNISTQGGDLTETSTIPSNNFLIVQGTLTVVEKGNSIRFTQKVKSLSELSVDEATQIVLRDDMAKVLDTSAST